MKKPPLANIGQRLRYARELAGLTQEQLAKLIGSSWTTIASIEQRGAVRTSKTLELAKAIGCRAEWLETGREPMIRPFEPTAEDLELARQINALPPQKKAAIRALVLVELPAASDERVEQFYKPAPRLTK